MEGSDHTQDENGESGDLTGTTGLESQEQEPISDGDLADPGKVTRASAPGAAEQSGDPLDPATKAAQAGKPFADGGPESGSGE